MIGLLKRKWDVKFQFQVLVPIEQSGEFEAPLEADATSARLFFIKWLKETHPEVKNPTITSFEPHFNDKPPASTEEPKEEAVGEPEKEMLN